MEQVFLQLVRMSVYASLLVIAVLALRLMLKRAPRWMVCLLWVLVAVRLVLPVSIPSRVSLMPAAETVERAVRTIPTIPQTAEPTIPAEPDTDTQETPSPRCSAASGSQAWRACCSGRHGAIFGCGADCAWRFCRAETSGSATRLTHRLCWGCSALGSISPSGSIPGRRSTCWRTSTRTFKGATIGGSRSAGCF